MQITTATAFADQGPPPAARQVPRLDRRGSCAIAVATSIWSPDPEIGVALRARSIIVQGLRDFLDAPGLPRRSRRRLCTHWWAAQRPNRSRLITMPWISGKALTCASHPKLYLKRLLVGGLERVYRDRPFLYAARGISTRHNPEFTMLEFYQAYATYETLMDQAERLFRHVGAFLERRLTALGLSAYYGRWLAERPFALAMNRSLECP